MFWSGSVSKKIIFSCSDRVAILWILFLLSSFRVSRRRKFFVVFRSDCGSIDFFCLVRVGLLVAENYFVVFVLGYCCIEFFAMFGLSFVITSNGVFRFWSRCLPMEIILSCLDRVAICGIFLPVWCLVTFRQKLFFGDRIRLQFDENCFDRF